MKSHSHAGKRGWAGSKNTGGSTHTASGPKKSQNAGTGDNPQGRGPSGKTQYCHATHSFTNPFVLITTNNNALWAHRQHQDEEDIIPATNGECPPGTTSTEKPPGNGKHVETPPAGPQPEGGAPTGPTKGGADEGPGPDGGQPGLNGVDGVDKPDEEEPAEGRGPAESEVLGEDETSPVSDEEAGDGARPALLEEDRESAGAGDGGGRSLPFTGLGLAAVLASALLALGAGIALRRAASRTRAS